MPGTENKSFVLSSKNRVSGTDNRVTSIECLVLSTEYRVSGTEDQILSVW